MMSDFNPRVVGRKEINCARDLVPKRVVVAVGQPLVIARVGADLLAVGEQPGELLAVEWLRVFFDPVSTVQ